MDVKDYVIKQLGRTKNKKYEQYVVSRIIHLLNDFDVKFVTQQYVARPEGRALTDLFFPQIRLHIEVDEEHHKANIEDDKVREADIVNATNHEVMRVDVSKSLDDINNDIDLIVKAIRNKVDTLKSQNSFIAWDLDAEFSSDTYINKGYIDVMDNVAFRTIKEACNCFGHNYSGYQKASAPHPNDNEVMLWFPKLYPNNDWNNNISNDEEIITERNEDNEKAREHVISHKSNKEKHKHQRIVFARVKGNLGDVLYRFRGLYKLSLLDSNEEAGLVWKRVASKVKTYPRG